MMKFSEPISTFMLPRVKRLRCVLLMLPIGVLTFGCDSHSSPFDDRSVAKASMQDASQAAADDENAARYDDFDDAVASEAPSLAPDEAMIAAATEQAPQRRSPMIADASDASTMQATLIGDYVGMMPCETCETVEVTLNLFADGSVVKTSLYQNPETPRSPLIESGIYRQDNDQITIVYADQHIENYRIQNSHLILLNKDKVPDMDYTLTLK